MQFVPHEIIIIGTMLYNQKHDVTYKEVSDYIKRRNFGVELEEDFTNFTFIKPTDSGYHVDNMPYIHPAIVQFLAQ